MENVQKYLGHEPTSGQLEFFQKFERFLGSPDQSSAFILKGYAGTGKTTIMKALLPILKTYNYKAVLLAPTGRAAKVLSNYTQSPASTIHRKIYRRKSSVDVHAGFTLSENKHKRTIFIVDEASMISGAGASDSLWSKESLLDDLIKFVYENDGGNRILFVGDHAQLPPVGSDFSPALNNAALQASYHMQITEQTLREVLRQNLSSGILFNATSLRNQIETSAVHWPSFITKGFADFYSINGTQLSDGLNYAYNKFGIEETMVICRSNKNANAFNQQIRNRILGREEELSGGDYLMVVKNNYHWLNDDEEGFIANGEIVRIKRLRNMEEMHGFRFAEATLELLDHPKNLDITAKILIDTLYTESPALSQAQQKQLYEAVLADYAHITNKRDRSAKLKEDPYYNALQVKFSYAITCHKAQGGQWDALFVDQGYLTEQMLNADFLKWLYTAITRAKKELYLVNFQDHFFTESK